MAGGDAAVLNASGSHLPAEPDLPRPAADCASLLAFAAHTAARLGCLAWAEAMAARQANYRFFEHLRSITAYVVFHDWEQLPGSITDTAVRPP